MQIPTATGAINASRAVRAQSSPGHASGDRGPHKVGRAAAHVFLPYILCVQGYVAAGGGVPAEGHAVGVWRRGDWRGDWRHGRGRLRHLVDGCLAMRSLAFPFQPRASALLDDPSLLNHPGIQPSSTRPHAGGHTSPPGVLGSDHPQTRHVRNR